MTRVDSASRHMRAAPAAIWRAFATPGAMERWIPPEGMSGRMLAFDFREGGAYRMRLTYLDPAPGAGKSSEQHDDTEVRLVRLVEPTLIVQRVTFESDRPEFAGEMTITWTFDAADGGTDVTVTCSDVPEGIRPEDHAAGLASSLANLARFTEGNS